MRKFMVMLVIVSLVLLAGCGGPPKNYDSFAQCLNEKGVVMFGAAWCSHCNAVKKEFGNAFRFMNYVECDDRTPGADPEKCVAEGVEYYPTFKFADKSKLFGELDFSILSQKTGCPLP